MFQFERARTNTSNSIHSSGSPFAVDNFASSVDLTDLNEFNKFYSNNQSQMSNLERPQNPFHKNFQSYHDKRMKTRNSVEDQEVQLLLTGDSSKRNSFSNPDGRKPLFAQANTDFDKLNNHM